MKKYKQRPITHIIHRKKKATKINHKATFKYLIDVGIKEINLVAKINNSTFIGEVLEGSLYVLYRVHK